MKVIRNLPPKERLIIREEKKAVASQPSFTLYW